MRRWTVLLVIAAVAWMPEAHSGVYGKFTYHLLDAPAIGSKNRKSGQARAGRTLRQRLRAPARSNASAVAMLTQYDPTQNAIRRGTATLVFRDPVSGHGLLLTNWHVAQAMQHVESEAVFTNNTRLAVLGVAAQFPGDDLALLEVNLQGQKLPVAQLHREPYVVGDQSPSLHVYTTGFDNLAPARDLRTVAANFDGAASRRVKRVTQSRGQQLIASGKLLGQGRVVSVGGGKRRRLELMTDLPVFGGGSGSPVFSSETHQLLGLRTKAPALNDVILSLRKADLAKHRSTTQGTFESSTHLIPIQSLFSDLQRLVESQRAPVHPLIRRFAAQFVLYE